MKMVGKFRTLTRIEHNFRNLNVEQTPFNSNSYISIYPLKSSGIRIYRIQAIGRISYLFE